MENNDFVQIVLFIEFYSDARAQIFLLHHYCILKVYIVIKYVIIINFAFANMIPNLR